MPTTGEDTIAHAILEIADKQPNGLASYDLIRREVPNMVSLTQDDLITSETRPNEQMWHQIMRNVQFHRVQKGNYIFEGYLEHVPGEGYRITSLGRTHLGSTAWANSLEGWRCKMPDTISGDVLAKIREQIEKDMVGLQIMDFRAVSDYDHDGDPILRLQIVYDEAGEEPRPSRVSALVRHIRPWLETRLPNTFPVFRFLTAGDFADEAR